MKTWAAPKEEDNYYDFFHSVHMFIYNNDNDQVDEDKGSNLLFFKK